MLAIMDTILGGRAAEELIFGPDKVTTGASNDLRVSFLVFIFASYLCIIKSNIFIFFRKLPMLQLEW